MRLHVVAFLLVLHLKSLATDLVPIHRLDGIFCRNAIIKAHKAKTTATASLILNHDSSRDDTAKRQKKVIQIQIR